jgi:hypothetical protein
VEKVRSLPLPSLNVSLPTPPFCAKATRATVLEKATAAANGTRVSRFLHRLIAFNMSPFNKLQVRAGNHADYGRQHFVARKRPIHDLSQNRHSPLGTRQRSLTSYIPIFFLAVRRVL